MSNLTVVVEDDTDYFAKIESAYYPDRKRAAEALRSIAEYLDPTYEPYEALRGDSVRPEGRSGPGVVADGA